MKAFLSLVAAFALMLGIAPAVVALPTFEDIIDWNEEVDPDGTTYERIVETDYPNSTFIYTHEPAFDPPAVKINSATLEIRHKGDKLDDTEVWYVAGKSNSIPVLIGFLDESELAWTINKLTLGDYLLEEMMSNVPWDLEVRLRETMGDGNDLLLDYSRLSGEYTPVPEASTLALFGSGFSGLLFFARKRGLVKF